MHVRADCAVLLFLAEPKPIGQTGAAGSGFPSVDVISELAEPKANGQRPVERQVKLYVGNNVEYCHLIPVVVILYLEWLS